MSTFVADLVEMFPAGIYDTKTFAEYKLRLDASYLTYVFRKLQRHNHDKEMKGSVCRFSWLISAHYPPIISTSFVLPPLNVSTLEISPLMCV